MSPVNKQQQKERMHSSSALISLVLHIGCVVGFMWRYKMDVVKVSDPKDVNCAKWRGTDGKHCGVFLKGVCYSGQLSDDGKQCIKKQDPLLLLFLAGAVVSLVSLVISLVSKDHGSTRLSGVSYYPTMDMSQFAQ
jgi:hypothetical protein